MTPSPDSLTEGPRMNTDRELWRETEGDTSIFRTEYGGIGINIAGNVIVKPIREWHDLARRALPAPSGEMREDTTENIDLLWHKVECWFGQAMAAKTPFEQGYLFGTAKSAFQDVQRAIAALRPSASPQGDRNEQIKAMIARFDEKVKTWTPQQALDYLVELGTHNADGNLTPEYGGSSPQGDESAMLREVFEQELMAAGATVFCTRLRTGKCTAQDMSVIRAVERTVSRIAAPEPTVAEAVEAFNKSDDFCPDWDSPLHEVWQNGVSWALERVGKWLGIKNWDADGASECIEGDVDHEIASIFQTAKLMDPETGTMATLAAPERIKAQGGE